MTLGPQNKSRKRPAGQSKKKLQEQKEEEMRKEMLSKNNFAQRQDSLYGQTLGLRLMKKIE